MKLFFTFLFACAASISFAQTKTFNGDYPLSGDFFWVKGKATYNYTEAADYTQTKNGSFNFTADMNGPEFGQSSRAHFSEAVRGQYKNNLKDGMWSHTITMTNIEQQNGSIVANVSYKDGIPNGAWTIKIVDTKTGVTKANVSINFKNGVVIGAYSSTDSESGTNISGNCDENGYLHGKQSSVHYDTETITEYAHGKKTLGLNRNVQSGEVSNRNPTDATTLESIDKVLELTKTNPDGLPDLAFGVDDLYDKELDAHFGKKFKFALQIDDFKGDAMYNTNNSYRFDWTGFRYLSLYKQFTRAEMAEKAAEKAKADAERKAKLADEKAADELSDKMSGLRHDNRIIREELIKKYRVGDLDPPSAEYPIANKTPIFKAFIALEALYKGKMEAAKENSPEKLTHLESLNKLYIKVVDLIKADTKEMEKLLKKTKDTAEMEKLLGL